MAWIGRNRSPSPSHTSHYLHAGTHPLLHPGRVVVERHLRGCAGQPAEPHRHAATEGEPERDCRAAHLRDQGGAGPGHQRHGSPLPGGRQRGPGGVRHDLRRQGEHRPDMAAGNGHRPCRPRRAAGRADQRQPAGHQHATGVGSGQGRYPAHRRREGDGAGEP